MGIFIKCDVLLHYDVLEVDRSYDGIIVLQLQHKITKYCIAIFCCYLPPELSKYGRDPDVFFEHLLQLCYMYESCDDLVLFVDYNARIGKLADYIADIDEITPRTAIDYTVNKHGQRFVEFLQEAKIGVVNGRVTPDLDNFTSVSSKGSAVVDYMLTGYETLPKAESCTVTPMLTLVEDLNISHVGRISDHSVMIFKLHTIDIDDNLTNTSVDLVSGSYQPDP